MTTEFRELRGSTNSSSITTVNLQSRFLQCEGKERIEVLRARKGPSIASLPRYDAVVESSIAPIVHGGQEVHRTGADRRK